MSTRTEPGAAAWSRGSLQSLRLRLFVFVSALAVAAAFAVGAATYASVHDEADALFDYQLEQMALSLRDQGRIPDAERAVLGPRDFDYAVKVWSIDGAELYSSMPGVPLPRRVVSGFDTVDTPTGPWRVYGASTPRRVVQVAQPMAARDRLASAAAWRSVLPIAAAAPLVAISLWWLVGWSLAPLQAVADAARRRGRGGAEGLAPLPVAGLPSEVRPLVHAFNGLLERLADAFEAQRAFVADAAHELRTPLTALKLQIGLAAGAVDEADRAESLARLRAGVDRAARLVEQLLALARADPGEPLAARAVDLGATVRRAVADAQPLIAQAGAQVTVALAPVAPVSGDPAALRSLVRNLVDNAVKYGARGAGELSGGAATSAPAAPRGAQVVVSVNPVAMDDGSAAVRLTVDDDGPGIPPDERERVFDRFHRRDGSRGEGSGLGLAIVRAVARRHGGRVTLEIAPTGGLRVAVELPAAEDASILAG